MKLAIKQPGCRVAVGVDKLRILEGPKALETCRGAGKASITSL